MNKMTMMGVWLIALFSTGCNQDLVEYNSNGEIVTDTSSLTTALHIVKSITIHIQ